MLKIIFCFLVSFQVPLIMAADSFPEELDKTINDVIYKRYLKKDAIYGWKEKNRFYEFGRIEKIELLKKNKLSPLIYEYIFFNDGLYLAELLSEVDFKISKYTQVKRREIEEPWEKAEKLLKEMGYSLNEDYVFENYMVAGNIFSLSFLVNKLNKKSNEFQLGDFYDSPRDFLRSFIVVLDGVAKVPKIQILSKDSETGKYSREIWDIFSISGKKFILMFYREYELRAFEVYDFDENLIIKTIKFGGN